MKKLFASILALLGLNSNAAPEAPANKSVIDDMRSMALNLKPEELGLNHDIYPNEVWGILMETGFENGSFTLLVLADGTTSLYFSNGGGIIGGGENEKVREAASILLSGANHFRNKTTPTSKYPYPLSGQVVFYLIGYSGITTYTAKEEALGNNKDTLSNLFHASHNVISELRQIEESRHN